MPGANVNAQVPYLKEPADHYIALRNLISALSIGPDLGAFALAQSMAPLMPVTEKAKAVENEASKVLHKQLIEACLIAYCQGERSIYDLDTLAKRLNQEGVKCFLSDTPNVVVQEAQETAGDCKRQEYTPKVLSFVVSTGSQEDQLDFSGEYWRKSTRGEVIQRLKSSYSELDVEDQKYTPDWIALGNVTIPRDMMIRFVNNQLVASQCGNACSIM